MSRRRQGTTIIIGRRNNITAANTTTTRTTTTTATTMKHSSTKKYPTIFSYRCKYYCFCMIYSMSILLSFTQSSLLLATALTEDDVNSSNNNGGVKDDVDVEEAMRLARENAKPWFLREFKYNGQRFLISPASVVCILVFVVNLLSWLSYKTSGTWAEANHILVKATDAKTKKALTQMKQDIGRDLKKFGAVAEQYSSCPSSKEKGNLGRFQRGAMTPNFDKAVFDPKTPLKTTIGPIETQFGLHLIYIRDRKM